MRVGSRTALVLLSLTALWSSGCNRSNEQIKVYRLAKPTDDAGSIQNGSFDSTNAPVKSTIERVPGATDAFTPPDWEPQPLSEMRRASFHVRRENGATADVSFVKLGPAAGNVLDNVNRWLAQLAQPPINQDKLVGMIQKLRTPRGEVDVVDLSGKPENGDANKDGRIVAGIASDEGTSFYKLRGNAELVGAEKPDFLKWIVAMRSAAPNDLVAASNTGADQPQIKWEIPLGWSPVPASGMRFASFTTPDKIDISIVTFPGEGGDDLGNINRWRQQIGLGPTNKATPAELKTTDATFSTVDLAGANARTIAAWTRKDGRAWFLKITGANAAVEKERQNFVKFVQSVRF